MPPDAPTGASFLRRRRGDLAAVAAISVLTVVYFFPLLTGHTTSITGAYSNYMWPWAAYPNAYARSVPQSDYAELSYPWNVVTHDALTEGTVPLWDAGAYGGGYDLYANGSSAVLYPPRLVALALVSPTRAHDLFLVFHVWSSGIAMYLLARELSRGRWAALFAAVAWMFATWNTGWMHLEVVTPLALFLPATVAAVHRAMTRRSVGAIVAAGAVCAAATMAGHVLLLGVVLLVAALYATALAVSPVLAAARTARRAGDAAGPDVRREALAAGGRLLLLGAVTVGLAALVLVPTALAIRGGQRVPLTYSQLRADYLARPAMLARLALPPHQPVDADIMQYLGFVGTATALLAVPGLLSRNRPGAWLARCLVVLVPLIMIGTPLTWLTWRFVPGMNVFRPYSRLIVLAAFGVVLAAAIGIDVLGDAVRRARPSWTGPAWRRAGQGLLAAVIVATAAQLIVLGRAASPGFIPYDAAYLMGETGLIHHLHEQNGPDGWPSRTLPSLLRSADNRSLGTVFYGNTAQIVGLDTTSGYDSNIDRRAMVLLKVLAGGDPTDPGLGTQANAFYANFEAWSTRFDLLPRLGVTHIATAPMAPDTEVLWSPSWAPLGAEKTYGAKDGNAYRVPGATAGPRLAAADEVVPDEQQALVRFVDPAFPAATTVVIDQAELDRTGVTRLGGTGGTGGTGDGAPATGGGDDGDAVLGAARGVNSLSVEVRTAHPAWVVVPDAWSAGWTASVNGRPVPVVRVNYNQRAVRVEAGTSTIAMRYRPPGLGAGVVVSVTTAVLCLGGLLWSRWRRRRPASDRP